MGSTRYPRRGHRLAPATLRDVLQIPLPDPWGKAHPGIMLCDLDETAWDRFGRAACESLAQEVIRAVGRAARMPTPMAQRALPILPPGMRLSDLDLEIRTIHCLLAAGIRPQDLASMTIERLLSLRGFWVKCLVDLLTALEHAIDHPNARRPIDPTGELAKASRVRGSFPRAGQRIAPRSLREVLLVNIPAEFAAGTPFASRFLADLDETAWDVFQPAQLEILAEQVVSRVNVCGCNRQIQERKLPRLPKGIQIEDLGLENRTYNCLRRAGLTRRPDEIGRKTVGDLLALKAFGAKCLVDVLASLETMADREGRLDPRLTGEAELLAALPEAADIDFSDPRLGGLLRSIDGDSNTVAELAARVRRRRVDPPDPAQLAVRLASVRERVESLKAQLLEDELVDIFCPAEDRDREIVAEYYGWDGGQGRTLEELGQKHGLSRERIRQVCVRAIKRNAGARAFAPVLDRALAFVAQRVPVGHDSLMRDFRDAGFTRCGLALDAVAKAADFLGRTTPFAIVPVEKGALVAAPRDAAAPTGIVQSARRAVLNYGATTLAEVAADFTDQSGAPVELALVRETLGLLVDFEWLDPQKGWFKLATFPQYGLANMVEKVLSVAPKLDVDLLVAAIARYRRSGRKVPPPHVLVEFCRRLPGVCIEGHNIRAVPPRDWRQVLLGVEAGMVGVLAQFGPVMERGEFEERCSEAGINRFSFNAIIMSSPVIAQFGRSVYGLVGAKVDRRTLESLSARRSGTPSRVLSRFEQSEDGKVVLTYKLSKAAISGGVITVPAALKDGISGQYRLRAAGQDLAGTLVAKNGCAWGLGPVLRSRNARPGDELVLVFDPVAREAIVSVGPETEQGAGRGAQS